jgi:hypothetical protein
MPHSSLSVAAAHNFLTTTLITVWIRMHICGVALCMTLAWVGRRLLAILFSRRLSSLHMMPVPLDRQPQLWITLTSWYARIIMPSKTHIDDDI